MCMFNGNDYMMQGVLSVFGMPGYCIVQGGVVSPWHDKENGREG